jgi:hypothetical protein
MFSLNLGLVTSRNDRSTPRDSVLPLTGFALSQLQSLLAVAVLLHPLPKKQLQ